MDQFAKPNVINLCVVDDHPIVFLGIELIIRKIKGHLIELDRHYLCGADLIKNLPNINSDVFLIDICLPDIKGHELARLILETYPDAKIGIYSSVLDRECILNSFKSGVLGYISKACKPEDLIEFIQTVHRGERHVRGIIADIIFEKENLLEKSQPNITKREYEILQYVLEGSRNKEIAEKLSIAERTVEFHKQNIYLKLEVTNSIDLYKAAKRLNLFTVRDSFY